MEEPTLRQQLAQLSPQARQQLRAALSPPAIGINALIAHTLKDLGITHIYGIAGIPIDAAMGECARVGLRVIGTRHQQGAVLMAVAHNYAAGQLVAAVMVSSGPAITNLLTGVLVAWDNAWPLLVITGGRADGPPGQFQALDSGPLLTSITKSARRVSGPEQVGPALTDAAHLAIANRPGPVYVEIDQGVFGQSAPPPPPVTPPQRPRLAPSSPDIAAAVDLLHQAQHPLLVLGKGLRWSAPNPTLRTLVAQGIPWIASPMGRGYVAEDPPGNVPPAASLALSTADVVLSVGARWDWTFRFGAELAPTASLIQIEIHSPEIGRTVTPTLGITGDTQTVLEAIHTGLIAEHWPPSETLTPWVKRLRAASTTQQVQWATGASSNTPMSLQTLFSTLAPLLPRDAITILDGNYTLDTGIQLLPCYQPASRFTPGPNGCMGTGVPFALGAQLAHPDRLVVAVCGDLAFGMTAMELETAIRHHIPVIVIVANNQGNTGAYRQRQLFGPDYPERVTMFVPEARYDRIAEAFGGHGAQVKTVADLKRAVTAAIAARRLTCINVCLDPEAPSPRT